jgi:preprotein translocase subunit SecY
MFNMFAGGAVGRMAIFALGIMPYISSSIIIQLLTSIVPRLDQLKKEGEQGRKVINQYTRYGTVILAALQAYGRMLTIVRDRVRQAKKAGKSLADVQGATPSAEFDQAWGKGMMTPNDFIALVYSTTK